MRKVFGFFETKATITRGTVVLTSFQMVHAPSVIASTGTC